MLNEIIEVVDVLDSPSASGAAVASLLLASGSSDVHVETIRGPEGQTDFVTFSFAGRRGKEVGGPAPTLGITGCLGSIGARPARTGMVSDADGAIVAVACALKLARMQQRGDRLQGDVIITTHLSPQAPVPAGTGEGRRRMMNAPVDRAAIAARETVPEMDAILSVDATKANRIVNHRGFALSPTVKEGYILHPSEDLLDLMELATGHAPVVLPLAQQDLVPGRALRHINGIMGPASSSSAPVVGVAITSAVAVPGIATGANQPLDLEAAGRFCIEVAKAFGENQCQFYDPAEFERLVSLYGSMRHFQTAGHQSSAP